MKKLLSILIILSLILSLFSCTGGEQNDPPDNSGGESEDTDGKGDDEMENKYYPTARVMKAKGGAVSIVAMMHDDGVLDTALRVDGVIEKYGLVCDCAMVVSKLWDYKTNTPKENEIAPWRELLATGRMKMVSHSMTHTWWGIEPDEIDITKLRDDPEKMELEIVRAGEVLREIFPDQRVLAFVYPGFAAILSKYGADSTTKYQYVFSPESRAIVAEEYIAARIGSGSYPIFSRGIDWAILGSLSLSDSAVKNGRVESFVKDLIDGEKLGLIYCHRVRDVTKEQVEAGYEYPDDVSMSVEYFEDVCKVIADGVASGKLWNTHYEDAILYVREAQSSFIGTDGDENKVKITLTDDLDDSVYNYPLTVKLDAAEGWVAVKVVQGDRVSYARVESIGDNPYVYLEIVPDGGVAEVTPISIDEIPE